MSAYLDHAATAPMPQEVLEVFTAAMRTFGNPASTHGHGQRASELLEEARERIAAQLGCDPAEVILTGGGTEAINHALKGAWWARRAAGSGPVLLIAEGEHHATIEAAEWLRDVQGAQIHWLPIDDVGVLNPATLESALREYGPHEVALVSFLWANNEVGTVQPVAELTMVAGQFGVPVHVDGVSALGQLRIDFRSTGATYLSLSAHKIGGPLGVGALIVDRRATLQPLLHGGSQQRARAGSQNAPGAVGFAAALEHVYSEGFDERISALASTRDRLIASIRELVPEAVLRGPDPLANSQTADRLAGNVHITIPGTQGDSLVYLLDTAQVSASVGSACQAGVTEISHVLLAMGLTEEEAIGALRLTFGTSTTEAEISEFLAALPDAVKRARQAGLA